MAFSMKKMMKELNKVEEEMKATSGFSRRLTRQIFRERMIEMLLSELEVLPSNHIDRRDYVTLLNLILKGKSSEKFLLDGVGLYFIRQIRFMENIIYKEFGFPYFCEAEKCHCFYE